MITIRWFITIRDCMGVLFHGYSIRVRLCGFSSFLDDRWNRWNNFFSNRVRVRYHRTYTNDLPTDKSNYIQKKIKKKSTYRKILVFSKNAKQKKKASNYFIFKFENNICHFRLTTYYITFEKSIFIHRVQADPFNVRLL